MNFFVGKDVMVVSNSIMMAIKHLKFKLLKNDDEQMVHCADHSKHEEKNCRHGESQASDFVLLLTLGSCPVYAHSCSVEHPAGRLRLQSSEFSDFMYDYVWQI